ncbi:MAG: DUF1552 domain-containing protein [Phycisphaeraceae bacterium]
MPTRREMIKAGLYALGAAGGSTLLPKHLLAEQGVSSLVNGSKVPTRFIFIHKGNGLLPNTLVPPSFDAQTQAKEKSKQAYSVDLDGHTLPPWMAPLASHADELTILQGLSGKMCTTGHHTWCSSLGAYKANERLSSIKWATVDFELAKLFPSPFEHIELACFPNGGGNSRGNINGIEKGFSARGEQQPNYAFGSPAIAMKKLFESVSDDQAAKVLYEMDRQVLAFVAGSESSIASELQGYEHAKVANYAESVESIRARNRKVEAMAKQISDAMPDLDKNYYAEDVSTVDRQRGFVEILLSTLISGMTNVVAFTADELGTTYTGLPQIENENVNLHDVGHGKGVGSIAALDVRDKVRHQHMQLVESIVTRLKSTPEVDGNGSMFDNTMLFYFPDNGETHHSHGTEWPFIVMAGHNTKMNLGRRYIRLPKYGDEGHKTLGNWYTSMLNAYGNPIEHYGALDTGLDKYGIDQKGAIPQFLA